MSPCGLPVQLGLLQKQFGVSLLESLLDRGHRRPARKGRRFSRFFLLPVEVLQPLVSTLRLLSLLPLLLSTSPLPLLLLSGNVLANCVRIVVSFLLPGVRGL